MKTIEQLKDIFHNYFGSLPITKAWIFGSYARNQQSSSSDIDILVDFEPNCNLNLFSLARIIIDLENLSGEKIDLVDHERIFDDMLPFIEKEKILIYERH